MTPVSGKGACAKELDAVVASLEQVDGVNERRRGTGLPLTRIHIALTRRKNSCRDKLMSVSRYALPGASGPEQLFTVDQGVREMTP